MDLACTRYRRPSRTVNLLYFDFVINYVNCMFINSPKKLYTVFIIIFQEVPGSIPGYIRNILVDPGSPVVIILTSGSDVRGLDPGRGQWILQSVKILSMTFFGREVKP